MARVLLGNLLDPSQTEGDGGCECVRENVRDSCIWESWSLMRRDLLRAKFPFCQKSGKNNK